MPRIDDSPVVSPIGVRQIKVIDLEPNPHNPRMLFDEAPMKTLRESIAKVGILVPLTVYEKKKHPGHYVILDGQRRWICAQAVGREEVPVNVVEEPSLFQNIITMFQIHKLRADWELMPTALKLHILMEEMKESNSKKLADLTGLDEAVIVRCKKLLSFHGKYQKMMLHIDPEDRWPADFFIELYAVTNDRIVNKFSWFKKNHFTDAMIEKKKADGIKAVTEFRKIKQHISNAAKAGKIELLSKKLKEFADDPSLKVDHLEIESAGTAAQVREMLKNVKKLQTMIGDIETDQLYGEEELWTDLESLANVIRIKLKEIGWRSKA